MNTPPLQSAGITDAPCALLSLTGGVITAVNNAAIRVLALPAEAVHGRTFASVLTPSSAMLWETQFNPLLMVRGAIDGAFLHVRHASGGELPVLVAATARYDGSVLRVELALLPVRERVAFEMALRTARDEAQAARAESERAREALAESIARQQATEAQLRQAQKMEVVGQLAGGIAHDFNNLLGIMGGHLEEASERLARVADPEAIAVGEELTYVRGAAERAAAVVRQLLAFSGRQVIAPTPLDLGALVREAVPRLQPLLGSDVTCVITVDPAVGPVIADRGQVEQIVLNLALNARDAIRATDRRGTLHMTVAPRAASIPEGENADRPGDSSQGASGPAWVRLTVTDDGTGMDETTLAQIFEPFYTTKPVGAGNGLGLSMVYGIVHQSGGRVHITSTRGVGTTVVIDWPPATARSSPIPKNPVSSGLADPRPIAATAELGASPVILLVDDEAPLRSLTKRLLERAGYTVIDCANGVEAWATWQKERAVIAGIISDLSMPGMDGHALRSAVRAEAPLLPMLLVSGYTQQPLADWGPSDGFLEKPFSREELLAAIKVLELRAKS